MFIWNGMLFKMEDFLVPKGNYLKEIITNIVAFILKVNSLISETIMSPSLFSIQIYLKFPPVELVRNLIDTQVTADLGPAPESHMVPEAARNNS